MGKSGGKKKKGVSASANHASGDIDSTSRPNGGGVDLESAVFLKRAHELKEEGNTRFQNKDYIGALERYDNALKLTPKTHPDRAVFHSNRAACLMQMKPIDYEAVISECSLALQVQPRFVRALLRRARAFEAMGKYEMAMQDVQLLLGADPNNGDALEIARRLWMALGPRQEAQQDLQSRPSAAALGASAVRGPPVGGLGPCLPARPVPKKPAVSGAVSNPPPPMSSSVEKLKSAVSTENGSLSKTRMQKIALKPLNSSAGGFGVDSKTEQPSSSATLTRTEVATRLRPLKLFYDHDIRLAQMPMNCTFKVLREIVGRKFPSSKSVLIKYKDNDGDLVTITSSSELKMAECSVDEVFNKDLEPDKHDSLGMLRLHVVEVSAEQEPALLEEEEERPIESEDTKGEESRSNSSLGESLSEVVEGAVDKAQEEQLQKDKPVALEGTEYKDVEIDDWLFEFAQLFRTHVGIDPDAHVDLHELGMELCTEALEETVTSEEAQSLFNKAAAKFQEVAALAFFNWGNVHMCAARKKIPLDESAGKEVVDAQLQAAYDWVKEKYSLAREKYEEALLIKPDFYEGLLALGQQQFEMAKLHWSFALAKKIDLSIWDPTETLKLFDSAEVKMKAATSMWEKLEEQRVSELKDPNLAKKDELPRKKKKQGNVGEGEIITTGGPGEISPEEADEQAAVMRSQIHLFWGNMMFERSQIECKLGFDGWKEKLDTAVERFKLAGASEADISVVLKNHCSNGNSTETAEKLAADSSNNNTIAETS
ncbi:hypothetical protein MLD38_012099 [Melastoma candidum]|uniref:Uncharacterized protein n=1 Tax=Melastoma candidum TaxID=119954 RepID=A0ACB9R579_9MYRT|nr:hypothetical protein MLD38_012099 [Melastoma candidum]